MVAPPPPKKSVSATDVPSRNFSDCPACATYLSKLASLLAPVATQ